jgi:branched-chain amino acid transport system ATP-binding protein
MNVYGKFIWEQVMTELLRLQGIEAGYGNAIVLEDIDLSLREGETLAVLGRNGVGKTTLMATIMGHTRIRRGEISWLDKSLRKAAPHLRARMGIGWVPQEREVFPSLSVEENLAVAALPGPWNLKRIYELFPCLEQRRNNKGNHLSGGEQQMLAMGRALMLNPRVLLLDEPLEGLAPVIIESLAATIRRMEQEGMAIVLVEQHAQLALRLTRKAIVLERGRIVHRAVSPTLAADGATLARLVGVHCAPQDSRLAS